MSAYLPWMFGDADGLDLHDDVHSVIHIDVIGCENSTQLWTSGATEGRFWNKRRREEEVSDCRSGGGGGGGGGDGDEEVSDGGCRTRQRVWEVW